MRPGLFWWPREEVYSWASVGLSAGWLGQNAGLVSWWHFFSHFPFSSQAVGSACGLKARARPEFCFRSKITARARRSANRVGSSQIFSNVGWP